PVGAVWSSISSMAPSDKIVAQLPTTFTRYRVPASSGETGGVAYVLAVAAGISTQKSEGPAFFCHWNPRAPDPRTVNVAVLPIGTRNVFGCVVICTPQPTVSGTARDETPPAETVKRWTPTSSPSGSLSIITSAESDGQVSTGPGS